MSSLLSPPPLSQKTMLLLLLCSKQITMQLRIFSLQRKSGVAGGKEQSISLYPTGMPGREYEEEAYRGAGLGKQQNMEWRSSIPAGHRCRALSMRIQEHLHHCFPLHRSTHCALLPFASPMPLFFVVLVLHNKSKKSASLGQMTMRIDPRLLFPPLPSALSTTRPLP